MKKEQDFSMHVSHTWCISSLPPAPFLEKEQLPPILTEYSTTFTLLLYELYDLSPPAPFMNTVQLGDILAGSIMHALKKCCLWHMCCTDVRALDTRGHGPQPRKGEDGEWGKPSFFFPLTPREQQTRKQFALEPKRTHRGNICRVWQADVTRQWWLWLCHRRGSRYLPFIPAHHHYRISQALCGWWWWARRKKHLK